VTPRATNFGGLTLPHVTVIKKQRTRLFLEVPLPGRAFSYRKDLAGKGLTFTVDGWIESADTVAKEQIDALADGNARILDLDEPWLQPFDNVFYYTAAPSWTNDTTAAYVGGSPFTVLANITDYMYFGHHEKFNLLSSLMSQAGSYAGIVWQYSQGNGAWNNLTVLDATMGFALNGTVTFTPPSDWAQDTVNSIGNRFWVRVLCTSVIAVATINQLLMNPCYNCTLQDPQYSMDPTIWDQANYELAFQQQENPSLSLGREFDPAGFDPNGFD